METVKVVMLSDAVDAEERKTWNREADTVIDMSVRLQELRHTYRYGGHDLKEFMDVLRDMGLTALLLRDRAEAYLKDIGLDWKEAERCTRTTARGRRRTQGSWRCSATQSIPSTAGR